MIINMVDRVDKKDAVSWVIIEALTDGQMQDKAFDPTSVDAKLIINGEEADLEAVFKQMIDQFDGLVLEEAKKLLKERLWKIQSTISEIEGSIDSLADLTKVQV